MPKQPKQNQLETIKEETKKANIIKRFLRRARNLRKNKASINESHHSSNTSNYYDYYQQNDDSDSDRGKMKSEYYSTEFSQQFDNFHIDSYNSSYQYHTEYEHDIHYQEIEQRDEINTTQKTSKKNAVKSLHIDTSFTSPLCVVSRKNSGNNDSSSSASYSTSNNSCVVINIPKPLPAPRHCQNVKKTRVTIAREKIILLNDSTSSTT